jgi:hemerythrin-like domain-containing protein
LISKASDLPGLPVQESGFEAPLEMLAACHGRIRDKCATLSRLKAHVATVGADAAAGGAARAIMRYFDTAARDHHEDEERDVFPALIESMAGSDPVCIRELVDSLEHDHRELERLWRKVRAWLVAIDAGQAAAGIPEVDSFLDLQERHAAREDQELLPMAERLLGTAELDQIGRAMRLRRGIASI